VIQGYPGPVIVLDAKGDAKLARTVWGKPGLVWEIGGPLKLDLLDEEPAMLAQQLLEGELFSDRGAVYRAIAEHAAQRAGQVLLWRGERPRADRILELVASPAVLREAIKQAMPPGDPKGLRWLVELDSPSSTVREGFQTFAARLGSLLDSPVGRSLGTGSDAVRLHDVLASNGTLLIRLNPAYGEISRKVGAWALVAMLRLAAELRAAEWPKRCLFVVDEPRVLQHQGRWLIDLFGTARDAGIGLVVADQGIAGLASVHPDLPDAVLRLTGWQLVFRQGSARDAEKMAEVFGTTWRQDLTWMSDGRRSTRLREEPRVRPSWLLRLPTGVAWLRVAPVGVGAREWVGQVAVALPSEAPLRWLRALPPGPKDPRADGYSADVRAEVSPDQEHARPPSDRERAAVYARIGEADEEGHQRWQGSFDEDGYPRASWRRGWRRAHRLVWKWEQGPIPRGWEIDHTCRRRWCMTRAHWELVTRGEHARREAERRQQDRLAAQKGAADDAGHAAAATGAARSTTRRAAATRRRGAAPTGGTTPARAARGARAAAPRTGGATAPGVAAAVAAEGFAVATAPTTSAPTSEATTVEQRRAEVQRLRAQGWSLRRIAEQLGISHPTVLRAARERAEQRAETGGTGGTGSGSGGTCEPPASASPDVVSKFGSDNGVVRDAGVSAAAAAGASPPLADAAGLARPGFAIALFAGVDRPAVEQRTLSLEDLLDLLSTFDELNDKRRGRCWSPTQYAAGATSRNNAGVEAVSCLVFDCDRIEPDWARLERCWYVAHTTYQHTPEHPRWRLVLPLAGPVPAQQWRQVWRRAHAALCPEADPQCKDASRQYYLPSHPPGVLPDARYHQGPLLDVATLPERPPEPRRPGLRLLAPGAVLREPTERQRRRAEVYMDKVIRTLAGMTPNSGRNSALNRAAWTLGHWVAAGALEQAEVEDALYAAAEQNGLVADDGPRQCWATIRSGLSKGLQQPKDLDADERPPRVARSSRRSSRRRSRHA
jgi:hypothetical protein